MIGGVLVCSCSGTLFEEVYATQAYPPLEDEYSQTGKLKLSIGSGRYIYRCVNCSKVHEFSKQDEPAAKPRKKKAASLEL